VKDQNDNRMTPKERDDAARAQENASVVSVL
jgi:hypothetical protein